MKFHEDDRRQSIIDLFPMDHGQVNVSYIPPNGAICGLHAHEYIDFFFLIKGFLKIGIIHPKFWGRSLPEISEKISIYPAKWKDYYERIEFVYLSDRNTRLLKLPHRSYHGYKNIGNKEAILLYWLDKKWTPNDDFKLKPGSFGEDWGIENK